MGASRLSKLLVSEGLVSEADRQTMTKLSGNSPFSFARSVLALGLLDDEDLASFVAEVGSFPRASRDLASESDPRALAAVDLHLLVRLEFIPMSLEDGVLSVAVLDPLDQGAMRQISFFSGYKVKAQVASHQEITTALAKLVPKYKQKLNSFDKFLKAHARHAALRMSDGTDLLGEVPEGEKKSSEVQNKSAASGGARPSMEIAQKGLVFENMETREVDEEPAELLDVISNLPDLSGDNAAAKKIKKTSPPAGEFELEESSETLAFDSENLIENELDFNLDEDDAESEFKDDNLAGVAEITEVIAPHSIDSLDLDGLEAALDGESSLDADLDFSLNELDEPAEELDTAAESNASIDSEELDLGIEEQGFSEEKAEIEDDLDFALGSSDDSANETIVNDDNSKTNDFGLNDFEVEGDIDLIEGPNLNPAGDLSSDFSTLALDADPDLDQSFDLTSNNADELFSEEPGLDLRELDDSPLTSPAKTKPLYPAQLPLIAGHFNRVALRLQLKAEKSELLATVVEGLAGLFSEGLIAEKTDQWQVICHWQQKTDPDTLVLTGDFRSNKEDVPISWNELKGLSVSATFWQSSKSKIFSEDQPLVAEVTMICQFKGKNGRDMLIWAKPSQEAPASELSSLAEASQSMVKIFARKFQ